MSGRFFGAAVTRLEDARLLVGKGKYVDDIDLPGMLHAAFVRASFAHGRIRSIDTGDALAMPGVVAIYTMADFADIVHGPMPPMAPHPLLKTPITYHPLADTEIRHVGEAIAIVLADNRANAEDAAAAVRLGVGGGVGCRPRLRGQFAQDALTTRQQYRSHDEGWLR